MIGPAVPVVALSLLGVLSVAGQLAPDAPVVGMVTNADGTAPAILGTDLLGDRITFDPEQLQGRTVVIRIYGGALSASLVSDDGTAHVQHASRGANGLVMDIPEATGAELWIHAPRGTQGAYRVEVLSVHDDEVRTSPVPNMAEVPELELSLFLGDMDEMSGKGLGGQLQDALVEGGALSVDFLQLFTQFGGSEFRGVPITKVGPQLAGQGRLNETWSRLDRETPTASRSSAWHRASALQTVAVVLKDWSRAAAHAEQLNELNRVLVPRGSPETLEAIGDWFWFLALAPDPDAFERALLAWDRHAPVLQAAKPVHAVAAIMGHAAAQLRHGREDEARESYARARALHAEADYMHWNTLNRGVTLAVLLDDGTALEAAPGDIEDWLHDKDYGAEDVFFLLDLEDARIVSLLQLGRHEEARAVAEASLAARSQWWEAEVGRFALATRLQARRGLERGLDLLDTAVGGGNLDASLFETMVSLRGEVVARAQTGDDETLSNDVESVVAALESWEDATDAGEILQLLDAIDRLDRRRGGVGTWKPAHVDAERLASNLDSNAAILDIQMVRDLSSSPLALLGWELPPARLAAWILRSGSPLPVRVDLGRVRDAEALWSAAGPRPAHDENRGIALTGTRPREKEISPLWSLLAPHLEGVGALIVAADGVAATIPWAALRTGKDEYLVERCSVIQVATLSAASGAAVRVGGQGDRRILALSDSAISRAPGPRAKRDVHRGAVWQPLPGTAVEVAALAALLGKENSLSHIAGPDADKAALFAALSEHTTLHLATHGFARAAPDIETHSELEHPVLHGLRSGLVLPSAFGGAASFGDTLYAEEVRWLDLGHVDLVVLSACSSAQGAVTEGSGLLGLRHAFLTAGAKAVVSALWAVDDASTAELMSDFYDGLLTLDLPAHEALRRAQLIMLKEQRSTLGRVVPMAWGAFVVDASR